MQTVHGIVQLRAQVAAWKRAGERVALIPTMGNLHRGHLRLVERARELAPRTVASIFVNPTQFGVGEDFSRYPRTPETDKEGLSASGCDVLFLPEIEDIYPFGAQNAARICIPQLGDILEGEKRPGHFDGVATVVARLFNIVQPDLAVFGSKDYQQLLVVRRMTTDLGFPIEIMGAPIMREANGLAMSSRNQYMDQEQRQRARIIYATLVQMCERARSGSESLAEIEDDASRRLAAAGLSPDYTQFRREDDLGIPTAGRVDNLVALIAARLGPVRLLDNQPVSS